MRSRALLILLAVVIVVLGLARANVVQTEVSSAEPRRATATAIERARAFEREGSRGSDDGERGPTSAEPSREPARASRSRSTAASAPDPLAPRAAPGVGSRRSPADPDPAAEPERTLGLRDRIGGRDALMDALRREFEPLAAECLDQASERAPQLRGMLALEFEIAPDPEHGAIVESLEPTADNEVADAELVECLRQTMLSASLPAIDDREALMITIAVGE